MLQIHTYTLGGRENLERTTEHMGQEKTEGSPRRELAGVEQAYKIIPRYLAALVTWRAAKNPDS